MTKVTSIGMIGLLLACVPVSAQTKQADRSASNIDRDIALLRQDLRDGKKSLVAANLPLNGSESTRFWPVYEDYTRALTAINDDRLTLIKEYAANYEAMTDQQASSYARRWAASDDAVSKVRAEWIPKFEQAVGPKKAAMFFQIDRRIAMLMDLQLASEIPLVQP